MNTPAWWQRNWKWVVPVGIVSVVGVFSVVILGLVAVVFGIMRQTEVYRTAVAEARGERIVVETLGAPIEEGFFVTGNIEVGTSGGYADLAIPIEGPRGSAVIYVEAEKTGGRWAYSTLEVALADGAGTIDLLGD